MLHPSIKEEFEKGIRLNEAFGKKSFFQKRNPILMHITRKSQCSITCVSSLHFLFYKKKYLDHTRNI